MTKAGHYDYEGRFICIECAPLHNYLHFDNFDIVDGKIVQTSPLDGLSELEQRAKLISLIYLIFNNEVSKSAHRLINVYLKKGYSYLDMIRTLEYFYIIKKHSTAKANNSIGIIPYVIEDARKYYQTKNNQLLQKYNEMLKAQQRETKYEVVQIKEEDKKVKQIDMTSL